MTNDVEQGTDKVLIARSRKIKRLIGAACLLVGGLAFSVVYLFRSSDSGVTITAFYALLLFIVMFGCSAVGIGLLVASLVPDRRNHSE